MATKAGLISAINGFITSVVNITKHRNSMLELVNELFQTTTIQTITTGTDVFWCSLRYKKIGNIVFIDGSITSKYTQAVENLDLITIPNSLFFAKSLQITASIGLVTYTSSIAQDFRFIYFENDKIKLNGSISQNQTIFINAHYQTND
jgi:hypothetical protein